MADQLAYARKRCSRLRFGEELCCPEEQIERRNLGSIRPVGRGLVASAELTPSVFRAVSASCERLGLEDCSLVTSIVFPAAEMQASCRLNGEECVIEVTSSLVERLNHTELMFVVGHELGHLLLDHHFIPLPPSGSIDYFKQSRAREISADRIGLLACGDADAAMRAILKTFSGLTDPELRFDTASFIQQAFADPRLRNVAADDRDTHPSFAVRARCLLRFSSSLGLSDQVENDHQFVKIEERTKRDFLQFSECLVDKKTTEVADDLAMWMWMSKIAESGAMTHAQSSKFADRFGREISSKVQRQFDGMPRADVDEFIDHKLNNARRALLARTPVRVPEIVSLIEAEIEEMRLG